MNTYYHYYAPDTIFDINRSYEIRYNFANLYHNMLRYMCQRDIQDIKWIHIIDSSLKNIHNIPLILTYKKILEAEIPYLYDDAKYKVITHANKRNEILTHLLPKEMPIYFTFDYIIDDNVMSNIYDFYKYYVNNTYIINHLNKGNRIIKRE